MDVVSKISARTLVTASVISSLFTVFTCYGIAVYLGHVHWWLPMISDCAVKAPESYLFRFGMITSANLLFLSSALAYGYLKTHTGPGCYNTIGLLSSLIASIGLATVGSINEEENNNLHSTAAVVFFLMYAVYMAVVTLRLFWADRNADKLRVRVSTPSMLIKAACTIVDIVALAILVHDGSNWSKNHIHIAMCEWIAVFSVQVFNLSCFIEYGSKYDVGTMFKETPPVYTLLPTTTDKKLYLVASK